MRAELDVARARRRRRRTASATATPATQRIGRSTTTAIAARTRSHASVRFAAAPASTLLSPTSGRGAVVVAPAASGEVTVVVVASVVAVFGEPAVACASGTPVYASPPGMPRPGVGSNGTHPKPARYTSGQAWPWYPRTVYQPSAPRSPVVKPTPMRAGRPTARAMAAYAPANCSQ